MREAVTASGEASIKAEAAESARVLAEQNAEEMSAIMEAAQEESARLDTLRTNAESVKAEQEQEYQQII